MRASPPCFRDPRQLTTAGVASPRRVTLLASIVAAVILRELVLDPAEFAARTGWQIKAEGACKGEVCIPLPAQARLDDGRVDAVAVARTLGMPVVEDAVHGAWALGPETAVTGRALTTAVAPELELPDADGNPFKLSSLHGRKVLLVAWASW